LERFDLLERFAGPSLLAVSHQLGLMQQRPLAHQTLGAAGERPAQDLQRLDRDDRDVPAVARVEVGIPCSLKNIWMAMP